MNRYRPSLLTLALASLSALSIQAQAHAQPPDAARETGAHPTAVVASETIPAKITPIRSKAQLDAYLQAHANRPTPFDCLSPGARERFRSGLQWGANGLVGLDGEDILDELTDAQMHDLMMLFGTDLAAQMPHSRLPDVASHTRQQCQRSSAGIDEFERRYNGFVKFNRELPHHMDDLQNAATLAQRFDALFREARSAETLRRLDAHDLRLLARAAENVMTSGEVRPGYVDVVQRSFLERERRGVATAADVDDLRRALLLAHRFDAARRLTADHPEAKLAPLPAFRDSRPASGDARHTVWRVSPDGKTLTRKAIDLGPTQVIVAAGCHFSKDAAEDISADPALGPVFVQHAHWLVLAPGFEDVKDVRDWNRKLPHAQAEMLYDRSEWADLPKWEQPTFYIVRSGKVIDSVTGWLRDPQANRQPLIDALRRAGLLDAAAAGTPE